MWKAGSPRRPPSLAHLIMKPSDAQTLPVADGKLPSSPPSSPSCACYCFVFSSPKRHRETKPARKASSDNGDAVPGKAVEIASPEGGRHSSLKKMDSPSHDGGGLFDLKKTQKDFMQASLKEKQLTREAQKLLEMVAKESQ